MLDICTKWTGYNSENCWSQSGTIPVSWTSPHKTHASLRSSQHLQVTFQTGLPFSSFMDSRSASWWVQQHRSLTWLPEQHHCLNYTKNYSPTATSHSEGARRKGLQVLSPSVAAPEHKAEKKWTDKELGQHLSVNIHPCLPSPKDKGGRQPQLVLQLQLESSHSALSRHKIQPGGYHGFGYTVCALFSLLPCPFSEDWNVFSCLPPHIWSLATKTLFFHIAFQP